MGFFSFLLFIILLCWIIALQGKVDSLSSTLKYVCRKINDYEKVAFSTPTHQVIHDTHQPEPEPVVAKEQVVEEVKESVVETPPVQPQVQPEEPVKTPVEKVVKEDFDIQKALLGNVFNKIGALAIIIAVVILIKLISPFLVITPLMKLLFGAILGAGFFGAGMFLHKKEGMKNYSEVLLGTGFATFFITTYCGATFLNLYSSTVALVAGGLLLVLAYMLSNKMQTPSMVVIGLIGGYLTPVAASANAEELFGFLIYLNILSLIFTLRNKKYCVVNTINLVLSMLIMTASYANNNEPSYVYPLVLWGSYVLYDIFRDKASVHNNVISWINYGFLTLFSLMLFHNAHFQLGILFIVSGIIYLLLAGGSRMAKNNLFKTYEYFVLLNVWLYIAFVPNDVQSVVSWAIVALIISILAAAFKLNYLVPAIVVFYSTSFIGALLAQASGEYCLTAKYVPIINPRTLVFIIPVIGMMFSSRLLKTFSEKSANWVKFLGLSLGYLYAVGEVNSYLMKISTNSDYVNFCRLMIFVMIGFIYSLNAKKVANITKSLLFNFAGYTIFMLATLMLLCGSYWYPESYLPILNLRCAAYVLAIVSCLFFAKWDKVDFFKYVAVFFGFLLCHSESAGIPKLYGQVWQYLISLSWVLYSGLVTIIGIVKNRRYLINSGIAIIILTIARIFLYDLAKVEALYKLVAFLALGIILMLVSYIYTANRNKK